MLIRRTRLDNSSFRNTTALRLSAPIFAPHLCVCGEICRKLIARQRVSKIGRKGRDELDHVKNSLSSGFITMQNLVAVCHTW